MNYSHRPTFEVRLSWADVDLLLLTRRFKVPLPFATFYFVPLVLLNDKWTMKPFSETVGESKVGNFCRNWCE